MCPIRPNRNRTITTDPVTTAEDDDDDPNEEPELRAVGSEEEVPHHNNNTMLEDPWSTTIAGYTPLSDLDLSETTTSTNDNTYAILASGRIPEHNTDDEADEDVGAPTAAAAADTNTNFEALAAVALSALDTEYQQTTSHPNTSGNHNGNWVERNDEEEEDEEQTLNIAAAFDRGLEERQQATTAGTTEFQVDWDELVKKEAVTNANKEIRPSVTSVIDTEAVRKVVQTLALTTTDQTTANKFQQKFAAWEHQQRTIKDTKYQHALIPTASVKAFRKTTPTPKSKLATHQLSRSATLADAMVRCSLLSSSFSSLASSSSASARGSLVLDIVGVDQVECKTITTIQTTFRPFCTWLDTYYNGTDNHHDIRYCRVHFRLIGRDLLVSDTDNKKNSSRLVVFQSPSMLATATCHTGVYHEFLENDDDEERRHQPDLIIAYNAGIWGYTEWKATIQYLASSASRSQQQQQQQQHATSAVTATATIAAAAAAVGDPATMVTTGTSSSNNSRRSTIMIITAYTFEECEGDHEQITEAINTTTTTTGTTTTKLIEAGGHDDNEATSSTTPVASTAQLLWGPEINPYGSQVQRRTIGRTNIQNAHKYYDNAAWQAWTFGDE